MSFQFDKSEKVMFAIYFLIIIAMLLNPPWAYFHPETGKFVESLGEYFIFDGGPQTGAQIHFSILIYRTFVLGILLGFIVFVKRSLRKLWNKNNKPEEVGLAEATLCQVEEVVRPASPSILRRYLSTFIDGVFMLSAFIAVSFVADGDSSFTTYARVATFFIMFCFYEPILTSRLCTIGQKITKIRVRTAVTYGKISIPAAYLRIIVKIFLGLISLFTIPITKDRRAIHDFASGSVVIMA